MARLILTSFGPEQDVLPIIRLADHLGASGHDVVLITHRRHIERFPVVHAAPLPFDAAEDFDGLERDWRAAGNALSLPVLFRRHVLPRATVECELIRNAVVAHESVLIASDFPGIAARIMAQTQRLPLISVFAGTSETIDSRLLPELFQLMLAGDVNWLLNREGWLGRLDLRSWWDQPRDGIAFRDDTRASSDRWPCRLTAAGAFDAASPNPDALAAAAAVVEGVAERLRGRRAVTMTNEAVDARA
jgi:UDP:flavonoid glycosyltransferase YjiC (YdhE family)